MARVLVDGHNLMHARGLDLGEDGRAQVLRDAALFAADRGTPVLVVFDAPHGSGTATTQQALVAVEYARGDADGAILAHVRRSRDARGIVVLTRDRALRAEVEALGARCDDPDALYRRKHAQKAPTRAVSDKPRGVSSDEVNYWLRRFAERDEGEW